MEEEEGALGAPFPFQLGDVWPFSLGWNSFQADRGPSLALTWPHPSSIIFGSPVCSDLSLLSGLGKWGLGRPPHSFTAPHPLTCPQSKGMFWSLGRMPPSPRGGRKGRRELRPVSV